jgi:hypothetical protein
MKSSLTFLACLLAMSLTASAEAPINDTCPVKGKPIRLIFRTKTKDGVVAFCCENCKSTFEESPSSYNVKKK